MKYVITGTGLWLFLFVFPKFQVNAQSTDSTSLKEQKNLVKLAPFQVIDNTLFLSYERFNKTLTRSLVVGVGYKKENKFDQKEDGLKIESQYRFYLDGFKNYTSSNGSLPYKRGIYTAIYLNARIANVESETSVFNPVGNFIMFESNRRRITALNPGIVIGIQRTFWRNIYFDLFFGGGFRFVKTNVTDGVNLREEINGNDFLNPEYEGIFPKIGFNIGFGF